MALLFKVAIGASGQGSEVGYFTPVCGACLKGFRLYTGYVDVTSTYARTAFAIQLYSHNLVVTGPDGGWVPTDLPGISSELMICGRCMTNAHTTGVISVARAFQREQGTNLVWNLGVEKGLWPDVV